MCPGAARAVRGCTACGRDVRRLRPDLTEAAELLEEGRERASGPANRYWAEICGLLTDVYRYAGYSGRANDTARDGLRGHAWSVLLQSSTPAAAVAARHAAGDATELAYRYLADRDANGAMTALDAARGLLLRAATEFAGLAERLVSSGAPDLAQRWQAVVGAGDPALAPFALRREVVARLASPPAEDAARGSAVEPPEPAEVRAALARLGADALIYLVPGQAEGRPGAAVVVAADGSSHLDLGGLASGRAPDLAAFLDQDETRGRRWADTRPHSVREMLPATEPTAAPWRDALDAACRWAWTARSGRCSSTSRIITDSRRTCLRDSC